jgi:hypothetical protein
MSRSVPCLAKTTRLTGTATDCRGRGAGTSAYTSMRSEVKKLDASMPVYELKTLVAQLEETLLNERLVAVLSAGLGLKRQRPLQCFPSTSSITRA